MKTLAITDFQKIRKPKHDNRKRLQQVSDRKRINVTQPALPPLEEFIKYLEKIWKSKQLTNQGPFHHQFEQELAEYLGVKHVALFANGTLALVTALQVLRITGEVITTPYSFVATTHALHWNNIKPVFADIDPVFCNLDPEKIEAAITPKTTAILPVHVYGNPCDVEAIQEIADIYGLKVIYDAAHAFGVENNGSSLLNWGDLSILSFHGTKVFTTMEGGAIICNDENTKRRIGYLKNFGFAGETKVVQPGINAKMNEMQAALGLLQLKEVENHISKRRQIARKYRQQLQSIPGIRLINDVQGITHNYSYFPIFVNESEYGRSRDDLYEILKQNHIYGRRYFYPLISHFPIYRGFDSARPSNLPTAEKIASRVICLPIYPDLNVEDVVQIVDIIRRFFG
jgi:dTDP-4-amino-4,6-dideoxygalactose transaminase